MAQAIHNDTQSSSTNVYLTRDWVKDSYSGNDVIEAFLAGKEKGKEDLKEEITSAFFNRLQRAQTESEQFAHYIQDKFDVHFKSIRLKFYDLNSFKALIIVDKQSYFSDGMNDVYKIIDERLNQINEENFSLEFSFTHNDDQFNTEALLLDGYTIRYETKKAG